jgi:hypothetical protein
MNNIVNSRPFLRTSREIPEDIREISVEVNKLYVDVASAVNARTIGLFPTGNPAITGENWHLLTSRPQPTLRQVYYITSLTSFDHNLNTAQIPLFTVIRGMGYSNASGAYFPIPFVNGTDAAGNIEIYVNATQVIFIAGADAPTLNSGFVLLEWLSNI